MQELDNCIAEMATALAKLQSTEAGATMPGDVTSVINAMNAAVRALQMRTRAAPSIFGTRHLPTNAVTTAVPATPTGQTYCPTCGRPY
jgi:hypothetical protein